jgi:light-regulated signal transduction histidine kinase (bacteriophytochrome)
VGTPRKRKMAVRPSGRVTRGWRARSFFHPIMGSIMQEEKTAFHLVSKPRRTPVKVNPNREPASLHPITGEEKKDGPVQKLLTDSALEELELQLQKPLRLAAVDLGGIVTRGVTMLSAMSAELGVLLRIRIRGDSVPVQGDFEKIQRSINALIIHLLTISQSQACVTVIVESRMQNGKRGMSVRLSANHVVVPWKSDMGANDNFTNPGEVTACRLLLEKNGGSLSVQSEDDEGQAFLVWLPLKGPRGR